MSSCVDANRGSGPLLTFERDRLSCSCVLSHFRDIKSVTLPRVSTCRLIARRYLYLRAFSEAISQHSSRHADNRSRLECPDLPRDWLTHYGNIIWDPLSHSKRGSSLSRIGNTEPFGRIRNFHIYCIVFDGIEDERNVKRALEVLP